MHFFYIDESGDTGEDLHNQEQPIFVLGGVSVRDVSWNKTQQKVEEIFTNYFDGNIPDGFELHSCELLSPNGEGPFGGHPIENRLALVRNLLDLLEQNSHDVHIFPIDKGKLEQENLVGADLIYNHKIPYLLSFDYLITYINWHIKKNLGHTAKGMVIFDKKEDHHASVEEITKNRRFAGAKAHRIKWIVEFSHPVDSKKNPMVQLSDLVVLCCRRFYEVEGGYREGWPDEVKQFYAECFSKIHPRIRRKSLVQRSGKHMDRLNEYLNKIKASHSKQWRNKYNL